MDDFEIGFLNSPAFGLVFFTATPVPDIDEETSARQTAKAAVVRDPSSLRVFNPDDDRDALLVMRHVLYKGRRSQDLAVASHENPSMLTRLLLEAMATPVGEAVLLREGEKPYRTDQVEEIADQLSGAVTNGADTEGIGFEIGVDSETP